MLKDFVDYYFRGGKRDAKREQDKLAYMMMFTDHDIGMLSGGYYIHYSFCEQCKRGSINEQEGK